MLTVQDLEDSYDNAVKSLPAGTIVPDALRRVNWMIEELRVSFFAQELGTATVSGEAHCEGSAVRRWTLSALALREYGLCGWRCSSSLLRAPALAEPRAP